ncbi:hypothetical protein AKJ16_DCAP08042 [Drosera capensis]
MAAPHQLPHPPQSPPPSPPPQNDQSAPETHHQDNLLSTYVGLSFSLFLALLPSSALSLIPTLESRNRYLLHRLHRLSSQLASLESRRSEDSKANARVVEIFASHRNSWRVEERRLREENEGLKEENEGLMEENEGLRERVVELRREVRERDELLGWLKEREGKNVGELDGGGEEEELEGGLGFRGNEGFDSRFWDGRASDLWQQELKAKFIWGGGVDALVGNDVQCEQLETMYQMKHFVARRESPWKVEGELTGVSTKLKLLEQELVNLERAGKNDLMKVPSLMRKQAKRYQALAGKIDDLCKRMQASDPSAVTSELRALRQPEFLLEAFRLQQRANDTGQKLLALQTEINNCCLYDEGGAHAKLTTRRSLDSIRNNFKEIQRNLEIWLARIIGDLKEHKRSNNNSQAQTKSSTSEYELPIKSPITEPVSVVGLKFPEGGAAVPFGAPQGFAKLKVDRKVNPTRSVVRRVETKTAKEWLSAVLFHWLVVSRSISPPAGLRSDLKLCQQSEVRKGVLQPVLPQRGDGVGDGGVEGVVGEVEGTEGGEEEERGGGGGERAGEGFAAEVDSDDEAGGGVAGDAGDFAAGGSVGSR